jgi:hypothetical protein
VTGGMSDDTLAAMLRDRVAQRASLRTELGLPSDRRIALCAFPDDRFALAGAPRDFADYQDLVRFVVSTLQSMTGFSLVIRLHPRAGDEARRLVEAAGGKISHRDTAALVPVSDLYVASVSATIRWAIACGKPVVNYDVYRLRLADYNDVPGVLRVEDRQEFVAVTRRLATDPAFFDSVRAKQEAVASEWAELDGQSGARIMACLDRLIAAGRKPR